MGAVPDLERMLGAALEPAGHADGLGGRGVDLAVEERLGGSDGQREVRARHDVDAGCARCPREALPLRLAEHDDRSLR